VLTEAQLNTVGYVLSRYGGLSGLDLETLTHNETPWQRADQSRRPRESARIEQEWTREYFVRHGVGGDDESDVVLDSDAVSEWLAGAEERRADVARPDSVEELRARLIPRAR
jgi:hypothetical protein